MRTSHQVFIALVFLCGIGICTPAAYAAATTTIAMTTTASTTAGTTALKHEIVAGRAQLAHLKKPLSPAPGIARTLQKGASGKDVRLLQQFLEFYGTFSSSSITGYFGPKTKQAVREFQRKESIDPVGTVGPKTRTRILELSGYEIVQTHMQTAAASTSPPAIIDAVLSTDIAEDGSGIGTTTIFASTTRNIYATITLAHATQDSEIGFVRSFNGGYVDSAVTHPSRSGLRYAHFQWSLKDGAQRIPGQYTLVFYINGQRAKAIAYDIY